MFAIDKYSHYRFASPIAPVIMPMELLSGVFVGCEPLPRDRSVFHQLFIQSPLDKGLAQQIKVDFRKIGR